MRPRQLEFSLFIEFFVLIEYVRGSTIAKIIGNNVQKLDNLDNEVTMWVYEEIINERKLTDIINTEHENVK